MISIHYNFFVSAIDIKLFFKHFKDKIKLDVGVGRAVPSFDIQSQQIL